MKTLLQRNTRYLLTWLPVILLICCIAFYVLMKMQAHHMQEKQLQLKQSNVWMAFVKSNGTIPRAIQGEFDIVPGILKQTTKSLSPRDTSIYLPQKNKILPFELLSSQFEWNKDKYIVSAYVSSTEISHLIIKVFITEAVILLLLLLSIVLLNKRNSQILWKPFFETLTKLKEYDVTRNESISLPDETNTKEFKELNVAFVDLIGKVNIAYYNQKQFVDNASHEMQTPLAIIRSKLELLINQPGLTESTAAQLGDITEANDKLSRMNRTLLLLAKIENNQFLNTESINFSDLLHREVSLLKKHYDDDFPTLTLSVTDDITLVANLSLLEILIHNLVINAVEHNIQGGSISINLSNSLLIIENTGLPLSQPAQTLFERFKKGSHKSRTTGLGLALVKQICVLYNYNVVYKYAHGLHKIEVTFP